jgi:hypothetical protein
MFQLSIVSILEQEDVVVRAELSSPPLLQLRPILEAKGHNSIGKAYSFIVFNLLKAHITLLLHTLSARGLMDRIDQESLSNAPRTQSLKTSIAGGVISLAFDPLFQTIEDPIIQASAESCQPKCDITDPKVRAFSVSSWMLE